MSLYEAELKFTAKHPWDFESIKKEFSKVVDGDIYLIEENSGVGVTDHYYFDVESKLSSGRNHVRVREMENHIELTSKRTFALDHYVRHEPEIEFSKTQTDVYALLQNMGFEHGLSIDKSNIVVAASSIGGARVYLSAYTAKAIKNECYIGKEHFVEIEMNKEYIHESASVRDLNQIMNNILKLVDQKMPDADLIHSPQMLVSYFTGYHPQLR